LRKLEKGQQEIFMDRCLELAKLGSPAAFPNPLVGCVIVYEGKIVAEGYHEKYGEPHAEVNAINKIPSDINISDCTLFVNLEPCSHQGKTPPCADLIIKKGFKKVVISNRDPNPLVAGNGIEKLKAAGILVEENMLKEEGWKLNKRFFTFHEKKRPYIILKWAESADGFISKIPIPDNRSDNMISDAAQLRESHEMRAEEGAILIGKNTVLKDNPFLTTRLVNGKHPLRVFIDKNLEVPSSFNIYDPVAPTLVINSKKEGTENNISFIKIDFEQNVQQQILDKLYELKIQSVIVEGGAITINKFIDKKLFDEKKVFVNKTLFLKNGVKAPDRN
jgi:diaminohydroxyphosphoribosylaminopyrimidine deaminase/5-amino-6-(5-phosphoribosylamino)uracil reductase